MGYSIHIQRGNENGESYDDDGSIVNPISLSEWKAAVEKTPGVRLASGDWVIVNPHTGATIRVPNKGGDAEVYFPIESEWIRVYSWSGGAIEFRGLPSFEHSDDPLRIATYLLATALDARIVGDDGEFYN
jgi:hypothetical protein